MTHSVKIHDTFESGQAAGMNPFDNCPAFIFSFTVLVKEGFLMIIPEKIFLNSPLITYVVGTH